MPRVSWRSPDFRHVLLYFLYPAFFFFLVNLVVTMKCQHLVLINKATLLPNITLFIIYTVTLNFKVFGVASLKSKWEGKFLASPEAREVRFFFSSI